MTTENSAISLENPLGFRPPEYVEGAAPLVDYKAFLPTQGSLWIFAYGSLMWNPEFAVRGRSLARVHGYHRDLCMRSTLFRGTVASPGLVLGLRSGGSCLGAVLEIEPEGLESALETLWLREMRGNIYTPRLVTAHLTVSAEPTAALTEWLADSHPQVEKVTALTFIANCDSPAYTPEICPIEAKSRVAKCSGERGSNLDYVRNTVTHLEALGIYDTVLRKLCDDAADLCE